MSTLTALPSTEADAGERSRHRIQALPILVLFPHNRCNCRCVMCDIWQIRQAREIRREDLQPHVESLRRLGVRWVVFSGGEPQMHTDLAGLSRLLRAEGIRLTLLTAGLLLEAQAGSVTDIVDDVIVSLDGPPELHDRIRHVPRAFEKLERGVGALRRLRPDILIRARSTVQKTNCAHLRSTLATAKKLSLNSISFLAADVSSEAFNRPGGWSAVRQDSVALGPEEVALLETEVESLIEGHSDEIAAGFVVESPEKLRRIVRHFRSQLGQTLPVAPNCNAPWVSAVIEADGTVRPCFFHRPLGNIHQAALEEILNGEAAVDFRRRLDIPNDPVCQRCVCSLNLSAEARSAW
jgi:Fe-coproporphyrin III synthase